MLSESERDVVLAALKFGAHILRQRGGNWRRFARLAADLERRPCADTAAAADRHTEPMTTTEVAAQLGCSTRTARRLAPRLGGHRVGTVWLIPRDSLEEMA